MAKKDKPITGHVVNVVSEYVGRGVTCVVYFKNILTEVECIKSVGYPIDE